MAGEDRGVGADEGKAGVDETDAALDGGEGGVCLSEAGKDEAWLLTGRRGGCATPIGFSTGGGDGMCIIDEGEEIPGKTGNGEEENGVRDLLKADCMLGSGAATAEKIDGAGAGAEKLSDF